MRGKFALGIIIYEIGFIRKKKIRIHYYSCAEAVICNKTITLEYEVQR